MGSEMKTGFAAWHYPHRSVIENIDFFSGKGFESISFSGHCILDTLKNAGDETAKHIRRSGLVLTLHYTLPSSADPEAEAEFREGIRGFGNWQQKHGLVENLTFDVPDSVRGDIAKYVDFALDEVPDCRIGLEDYGLTEAELEQLARYENNARFGHLIDIGHLFIRLRGKRQNGATLFRHSGFEGETADKPDAATFLAAFKSKTFPVWEIHLHNNDGVDDTHLFLEDGAADIAQVAKAIRDFGFGGIVTIESAPGYRFPSYGKEADDGILRTLAYWKKVWRETD